MVSETQDFRQGNRCQFVLFNPNGFQPDFSQTNDVGYAAWQLELAPTTGTPHYQGVAFFRRTLRCASVNRTYFDNRASLTRCNRAEAAIAYCTREKNDDGTPKRAPLSEEIVDAGPWTYGDRDFVCESGSHKRKHAEIPPDQASLIRAVETGEIHVQDYWHHRRYIQDRDMTGLKRTWQTKVLILWGRSGTGKSTLAEHLWPNAFYAQKEHGSTRSQGKLWFDGYDRHDVVIIDDYHYTLSLTQFKELVSKNGHHVPCKGSKVPFVAKLLVILSNDSPDVWWPNQTGTEHYEAAKRRMQPPIGKVIQISSPLVKYFQQDGEWCRRWEPGTPQLVQQIKDFIEYDARNIRALNDDQLPHLHTPVPVIHSGPVQVSSPTPQRLPSPPRSSIEDLPASPVHNSPPSPEPQEHSQESVSDVPVNRGRRPIQLSTSQHPVSNASAYNLRTKRLKFVHHVPSTQ